jgi:hypothetical protein
LNAPDRTLLLSVDEKAGFKRWTAPYPFCRCARASRSGARMITFATARRRCSRRSMSRPAGRSANSIATSRSRVPAVLNTIDAQVPADLHIHLILDDNGKHKTPVCGDASLAIPGFTCIFHTESASWLDLIERWFASFGRAADQTQRASQYASPQDCHSRRRL